MAIGSPWLCTLSTNLLPSQPPQFFSDRQESNVYVLRGALRQFDAFLPRYVRDRTYLETLAGAEEAVTAPDPDPAAEFVRGQPTRILELGLLFSRRSTPGNTLTPQAQLFRVF